jgi:hypothetical protein
VANPSNRQPTKGKANVVRPTSPHKLRVVCGSCYHGEHMCGGDCDCECEAATTIRREDEDILNTDWGDEWDRLPEA